MIMLENMTFGEERALYASREITLRNCAFDGAEDGESALKESRDVTVLNCRCNLRYPFWHDYLLKIRDTEMTSLCRAAIWYSEEVEIVNSEMYGIKALRECRNVVIDGSRISSPEFGWSVHGIKMTNTSAESEYFMLRADNLEFSNVRMSGKYSFQYIKNAIFDRCEFNTKDAFWHARNVTVKNSVINGEYLGWYSEGLTLINCKIVGTQPLCYCKKLTLTDCVMEKADLCFEKSEVDAKINSSVVSIKNPASGVISVESAESVIIDDPACAGRIIRRNQTASR